MHWKSCCVSSDGKGWTRVPSHNTMGGYPRCALQPLLPASSSSVLHLTPFLPTSSSLLPVLPSLIPLFPPFPSVSSRQAGSGLVSQSLASVESLKGDFGFRHGSSPLEPKERLLACWEYILAVLRRSSRGQCNCQILSHLRPS